jgi:hypothetical protein
MDALLFLVGLLLVLAGIVSLAIHYLGLGWGLVCSGLILAVFIVVLRWIFFD